MYRPALLLFYVWWWCAYLGGLATARAKVGSNDKITSADDLKKLLPVELSAKDFGTQVGDGNVWLIEFYAPWCSHCNQFKGTYDEIAIHFHEHPEKNVKVAKVNGDTERALTSRFNVPAYPSFYLVDGYSVYKYEGSREKQAMIRFADGAFKKTSEAIPFLSSPMGPLGLLQGAFLHVAYGTFQTVEWLQKDMGLSPFFAVMLLFSSCFVGVFIMIVVAAITLTPKEKQS